MAAREHRVPYGADFLRRLLELPTAAPVDVSADGETLLVACDRPGTAQLHRLPARGGELEHLTYLPEPVDGMFVPGSGRVLIATDEGGNERMQLHLLDARSHAEPEPLVVDPRFIHREPCISRDGSALAYATNRRNGRDFDVVVRSLETGAERCVYDGGGSVDPAGFSPDGRRLALVHENDERSGANDVLLVDLHDGAIVHATLHDDAAYVGPPAWLADGSAFFAPTSIGRDTTAIGRYDLAAQTWDVVLASRWDLDCALDEAGRTLFIQHGANDPRVPLGEAEQIHRALTEKGIRRELVVYRDEGHSIAKLENRIDTFLRAAAFLDDVVGRA